MAVDPQPQKQTKNCNFSNIIATLKKKASQLSALCDVPVVVLGFTPDGGLFTLPEHLLEVKSSLKSYKRAASYSKGSKKRPLCADLEGFLGCKKIRVSEEKKQSDGISAATVQSKGVALDLPHWVGEGFLESKLGVVDEKIRVLEEEKLGVGGANSALATVQSEEMALALAPWIDEGFFGCKLEIVDEKIRFFEKKKLGVGDGNSAPTVQSEGSTMGSLQWIDEGFLESKLKAVDERIRVLEEEKLGAGDANSSATVESEVSALASLQWIDEGFFGFKLQTVGEKVRVSDEKKQGVIDANSAARVQSEDMALALPHWAHWVDDGFLGCKLETVDDKSRVLEEKKQSVGDDSSAATVQSEDLALVLPQWTDDDEVALELDDDFWCLPFDWEFDLDSVFCD